MLKDNAVHWGHRHSLCGIYFNLGSFILSLTERRLSWVPVLSQDREVKMHSQPVTIMPVWFFLNICRPDAFPYKHRLFLFF